MLKVTISTKCVFERSFHGDNDSLAVRSGEQTLDDFTLQHLNDRFNNDNKTVNATLPDVYAYFLATSCKAQKQ